jgi:hypothetical protein
LQAPKLEGSVWGMRLSMKVVKRKESGQVAHSQERENQGGERPGKKSRKWRQVRCGWTGSSKECNRSANTEVS